MVRLVVLLTLSLASAAPALAQSWRAMMAPGPLAEAHAPLEEDCDSCHLSFAGVPNEKCLACHEDLAAKIETGQGFHASVADQKCVACHDDHEGRDASLTRKEKRAAFTHAQTGFALEGSHGDLPCAACHDEKSPAEISSACVGCHADAHDGEVGMQCTPCHKTTRWSALWKTLPAHEVPTTGGHAGLECAACHVQGAHLEGDTVPCATCHVQAHGGTTAACETCHVVEDWHEAEFDHSVCTCALPEEHQTAPCLGCHADFEFTNTPSTCEGCHEADLAHEPLGECGRCHLATSWEKRDEFDHNVDSPFALEGLHLGVSCDQCHPAMDDFQSAPQECAGCHADAGRVVHGDFGDCAPCHTTAGFAPSTFDHASTGFPLTGQHAEVPCQDCHGASKAHARATLEPIRLASAGDPAASLLTLRLAKKGAAPRTCVDCHADPHGGSVGTRCGECHATTAWMPPTFAVAAHAKTRFPLEGAHVETDCDLCHVEGRLKPLPLDCAQCHMDRHAGQLGNDCDKCHNVVAFADVDGFDHETTGFALAGPHAELACATCHEGDRSLTMKAAAEPNACQVCHVPPHSEDLGTDCESCHPAVHGVTFAMARGMEFDHGATGFRLTRRHRGLACAMCHPYGATLPVAECAACHLDPHAGGMSLECELCHKPDRWRLARFDHDLSGWPLRGRHFVTPCSSCHVNQRWVGVPIDCFGCHDLDARRANQTVGNHPFGLFECQDCHTSQWTWRAVR